MAIIPQNTPGQRADFNAPIFTDAVGKSMLICTPLTEKETIFRVIPELNEQGVVIPMCRTYDATGHDWSNIATEDIMSNGGILAKFTGSVIPARPGDTSGAPDTSIAEPDLPFRGLQIRLKGRMNKNTVPVEHQAQVTQIMNRMGNRPAPLSCAKVLLIQAWILCDNGTWLVDANRQAAPRRGFIMLKPSHSQALRQLLIEGFTAGLDFFSPDTGACFRAHGFPAGTFPGQQLATGTVTLCTMQGAPLTFPGATDPPTPQGRIPVTPLAYGPQTASPLPPSFWQGPSSFMPWGKCIRRHTLQDLLARQLACFGPAVCQLAFPTEYGAPVQVMSQPMHLGPPAAAFGQPPAQVQTGPPAAAWGQQPQAPVAPQGPPAGAFGQPPAQLSTGPTFQTQPAPGAPAPAQPAFGQQQPPRPAQQPAAPQGPPANAFGAPSLHQAVAPQQPAAAAPAPVVVTSTADAAALQAAFAQTLGAQIPKV